MCSISGIIGMGKKRILGVQNSIEEMMRVQNHRGPDDRGMIFANTNIGKLKDCSSSFSFAGFGFNRLSIRDVSMKGHQPMLSSDKESALLYNGELYNCDRLKLDYLNGIKLNSQSDTEIILRLYENIGMYKTVSLLNGMFSLAVFDLNKNTLFLARDRMGIKPLYYYIDNKLVVFSSEMKGIIASRRIEAKLDRDAFYESLIYGYTYKKSLIADVFEVNPGEIVEINILNGIVKKKSYWKLEDHLGEMNIDIIKARQQCADLLRDSVKRQMASDVPLGCQLSGGVDSSIISYYMMQNRKCVPDASLVKDKAINIVVPSSGLCEGKYGNEACQKSNMTLETGVVQKKWVVDNLPRTIWHLDGIPAFTNEVGILLLSKIAKNSMTVMLSGEGADELFFGYRRMYRNPYMDSEIGYADGIPRDVVNQILVHGLDTDYVGIERKKYYISLIEGGFPLYERVRAYELNVRLPRLLQRQDRMSMACSVEDRVPFLDNEIIDFALSLPFDMLISSKDGEDLEGKYILKEICSHIFGKDFAYRSKMGFGLPIREYLVFMKECGLFDLYLQRMRERELINPDSLGKIYIQMMHQQQSESIYSKLLWRLISLEMFIELFVEGRDVEDFSVSR